MRREKGTLVDAVVSHPDPFMGSVHLPPSSSCSEDALLTAIPFFGGKLMGATSSGNVLAQDQKSGTLSHPDVDQV